MTALVMAAVIVGLGVVPAHEWWTERRRSRAADARGLEAWHAGAGGVARGPERHSRPGLVEASAGGRRLGVWLVTAFAVVASLFSAWCAGFVAGGFWQWCVDRKSGEAQ